MNFLLFLGNSPCFLLLFLFSIKWVVSMGGGLVEGTAVVMAERGPMFTHLGNERL